MDVSREYTTQDGRKVSLIGSKVVAGVRIFVGTVEGERSYKHWHENGSVFGDKDKTLNLKVNDEANN